MLRAPPVLILLCNSLRRKNMNLAKKGTVLLTALSVFALASCGAKEEKLDYNAAKEWVTKNYTSKEVKEVKQTKVHWDYSKTVGEDETATKVAKQYVAAALKNFFVDTFTDAEYATEIFEKTVDGAHGVGNAGEPLNGENFDEAFDEYKDNVEFAVKGKSLIIMHSEEYDVTFAVLDRSDKRTCDEKGYLQTWETTFDKKDVELGGKKATIHLEDKLNPIFE